MTCAGLGVAAGITATGAAHLARGEYEIAGKLVSNSVILGIIFAVLSSILVAIFLSPIIDFMGADAVREEATQHMIPYILLSPTITLLSILGGMLRAEGAATKSTIVQTISAVLNMVIDPILIYMMGMGVFGAGLSTVISSLIAILVGFFWYLRGHTIIQINRSNFGVDKEAMSEVLGIGGPKTIQMIISNLTDFLQRIFIPDFDTSAKHYSKKNGNRQNLTVVDMEPDLESMQMMCRPSPDFNRIRNVSRLRG